MIQSLKKPIVRIGEERLKIGFFNPLNVGQYFIKRSLCNLIKTFVPTTFFRNLLRFEILSFKNGKYLWEFTELKSILLYYSQN